ncbi:alkaline phosphatase family protein [Opitutus sp. ER46]|uniref:alkaline phosphatase family protein n=1 Tax=Opitutus sp. ER46 TaxID=2161864 RepID=UPI000D30943D|nr:alkaline phosphatase family protein [Opitutus sp. ER46]PTX92309.1 alkaline phosphatase family protein [Opitutus sp. ER46]
MKSSLRLRDRARPLHLKTPWSLVALAALALAGLRPLAAAESGAPVPRPHVVLITIDGFPARMLDDPKTFVPHLRALAAGGVRAEAMVVSSPASTWSNHTTLVTGVYPRRHSVLPNAVVVRGGPSEPVRMEREKTAREMVAVPSLFDLLHQDGLTTAGVNWPCTRNSPSIDDNFPDTPGMLNVTTPRLVQELVAQHVLRSPRQSDFAHMEEPGHDVVWTAAACHLIRTRMPDFMAVHLLATDELHHAYGPESLASYVGLALADRFVGDILAAIRVAGQEENTTVLVVGDHGFASAQRVVQPNVLLREAGLLKVKRGKVVEARIQVIALGGSAFVYCTDPATREADKRRAAELFAQCEGVAEVIGAERFAEFGLPEAGQGGCGELILRAKPGYAMASSATAEAVVGPATKETNVGFHGHLADTPEMNAIFIARGRGIKAGAKLEVIHNVDVAPTIMRLLGRDLSAPDGRVLWEILDPR